MHIRPPRRCYAGVWKPSVTSSRHEHGVCSRLGNGPLLITLVVFMEYGCAVIQKKKNDEERKGRKPGGMGAPVCS